MTERRRCEAIVQTPRDRANEFPRCDRPGRRRPPRPRMPAGAPDADGATSRPPGDPAPEPRRFDAAPRRSTPRSCAGSRIAARDAPAARRTLPPHDLVIGARSAPVSGSARGGRDGGAGEDRARARGRPPGRRRRRARGGRRRGRRGGRGANEGRSTAAPLPAPIPHPAEAPARARRRRRRPAVGLRRRGAWKRPWRIPIYIRDARRRRDLNRALHPCQRGRFAACAGTRPRAPVAQLVRAGRS